MEINGTTISVIGGAVFVIITFLLCFCFWTRGSDEDDEDIEQQRSESGLRLVEDSTNSSTWVSTTIMRPEQQRLAGSYCGSDMGSFPENYANYQNLRRISIPKATRINYKFGSIPE